MRASVRASVRACVRASERASERAFGACILIECEACVDELQRKKTESSKLGRTRSNETVASTKGIESAAGIGAEIDMLLSLPFAIQVASTDHSGGRLLRGLAGKTRRFEQSALSHVLRLGLTVHDSWQNQCMSCTCR